MIRAILRRGDDMSNGRDWLDSAVKCVQLALLEAGHPVQAEGEFGPGTEQAVKTFQQAQGLSQSGIIEKATWGGHYPQVYKLRSVHVRSSLPSFSRGLKVTRIGSTGERGIGGNRTGQGADRGLRSILE